MSLPPDPEGMNDQRAEWGGHCLQLLQSLTNCEVDEAPGDLIANILHWCDRNGMDPEAVLLNAQVHYAEETQG